MWPRLQALSAQEDLEKVKDELKNAVTGAVMAVAAAAAAPLAGHAEKEHDEHDEDHSEATAELCTEGVRHLDLCSEEKRITETQKNERVMQHLQVGARV